MTAESDWGKSGDRGHNAPFPVFRRLGDGEKYICWRLVKAGPLGWNKRSLNAAHIRNADLQDLVRKGIVRRATLLELATELLAEDGNHQRMEELEKEGGFFATTAGSSDREFYVSFDWAIEIVEGRDTQDPKEERYQVARWDLYKFIQMLG